MTAPNKVLSVPAFTEAELLAALRLRYWFSGNGGAGRYAFLTHVRTGAAWDQQEMDAVAIGLWPSDSHSLLAFEVKVSRSDWLHEIKPDTSKSARARQLCDSFTVVAPAGVVADGELPEGWGLVIATRSEDGVRLRQKVKPALRQFVSTEADAISRSFLAALLRAAGVAVGADDHRKRESVNKAEEFVRRTCGCAECLAYASDLELVTDGQPL